MTVTKKDVCLSLILSTFLFNFSESFKLNSPRLLLPYKSDEPTHVVLEVTDLLPDEYVEWISTAPSQIKVSPIHVSTNHSYSKRAMVSVISSTPERRISYILAFQKGVPENVIACEIITDSISSIEISYSSNDVFLDGTPEMLNVIARNEKGHMFSSLNGVEFQWNILSIPGLDISKTDEKLRFITFSNSTYSSPLGMMEWQVKGLQSSFVLVEGQHVGEAIIEAKLKNSVYSEVNKAEVKINVKTNLCLNSCHHLYLLCNAGVHCKLESLKLGRNTDVWKEEYTMISTNQSVARFNSKNILTAFEIGNSVIVANYFNGILPVKINTTVHVVDPSYMILEIDHDNKKALKEIRNYEVFVKLFDDNHHLIYPSENLRIRVTFPNRLFYLNDSSPNGTYHVIRSVVPGTGTIRAEFRGIELPDGSLLKAKKEIKTSRKITIYQAIQIAPVNILLPWDPVSKSQYDIPFKASGGTGSYIWTLSNTKSANVTYQTGKTENTVVHVKETGEITIFVNDEKHSEISSFAKLSIQPVAEIEVQPTVVEAEVGSDIIIPVALLGYEDKEKKIYKMFDDCSQISISVDVIDKSRITYQKDAEIPPFGKGCLSLLFQCKFAGHSRVNIQYDAAPLTVLKTTLVLSCHKPVKPVNPVRVAVLAVGTSKEIVFEGGPRPWPIYQKGHYTNLIAENPDVVGVHILNDPVRYNRDLHVFELLCRRLGETVLKFNIGNEVSPTNKNPAKLEASVKIICGNPDTFHLAVKPKSQKKKVLLTEDNIIKVPFYGDRTFEVDIWVRDSIGRKFANISSLDIHWELSNYTLANLASHREFSSHIDGSLGYRKVSRNFQIFEMSGSFGSLKVTSKLVGYRKDILEKQNISYVIPLKSIEQSIDIKLISMRENLEKLQFFNQENKMVEDETCTGDSCPS